MSFLVSKPERIRRWVSEKFIVEGLRELELFGEQPLGDSRRKTNEASSESIASSPKRDAMSSFSPDSNCYELLTIIGQGFEDLMIVNLARYKPTGDYVTVRRINLEACTNEMVTFLQGELHVSKLFNHPNIVPYKATFIADNELWVVTPFMAYGSAKDLICTHFTDGMCELAIAYILQGVLKALDYIHHMGYVHRSVKASHILISVDGKVYLSGLRSNLSMINHGQRLKVVHDFPKYSIKVLPWLSPEVLQQNLQGYDAKSDIYSVGITACELANGHVPFKDMPPTQMLLEKLNGTVPCLLDTTTIPADELTMKPSRSGANSGIGEGLAVSNVRASNGESTLHPYLRTFSPHFHNFVEQCLQRNPDFRALRYLNTQKIPVQKSIPSFSFSVKYETSEPEGKYGSTSCSPPNNFEVTVFRFAPRFYVHRESRVQKPSASTLLNHSYFKQIKRRASEALPELLRPVTPITNFEGTRQQDPSGIFGLVSSLEQLEVDDWEF